jgi:hypothetical protein
MGHPSIKMMHYFQELAVVPIQHFWTDSTALLVETPDYINYAARHAEAVSLSTSRRNSASGIANSVKPQFKQTRSFGKTHTLGLSRLSRPGE